MILNNAHDPQAEYILILINHYEIVLLIHGHAQLFIQHLLVFWLIKVAGTRSI